MYGVNSSNDIYTRPVDGSGKWRQIPGKLKHITASGTGELFGIDINNGVWRSEKPGIGEWERMSGYLKQCDASADALVGVDENDNIYYHSFRVVM